MKKMNYQAPALKVIEFKVERGFQASGGSFSLNTTSTHFEMIESENGFGNEVFDRISHDESSFWGN